MEVQVRRIALILLFISLNAGAQSSGGGSGAGTVSMARLKEGTEVMLKFSDTVSSKTAAEGDKVSFILSEDLNVRGVVVAKAGSTAIGEIVHAQKAGHMGKAGEMNIRLSYLKAGDNRIRLRGSKGKEGDDKQGTAIALTVLFGPLGLLKHGKQIEVPAGTPLTAFVEEDVDLPAIRE
jgi:hypothetical protein